MKKTVFFAVFLLLFLAPVLHAATATDEITLKQTAKGEWRILNSGGQQVGTLRSMEEGAYSIQLNSGEYMGIILKEGLYQKPGRHARIGVDEAQLFIDTWKAIQKLK